MKISAVFPDYAPLLDHLVPEIEIVTVSSFVGETQIVDYALTYEIQLRLTEDEFKKVINAV